MATSEAFARVKIDAALAESGWNLVDTRQVRLELSGPDGRSDYVLMGQHGPLAVLEAKAEGKDPYDAKEQARGYAENLRAPFVILSNGSEHWFWNYERREERDARRIERLPSLADLERLRLKNLQPPRPLLTEIVGPDYLVHENAAVRLRGYQIAAIDTVGREFDELGKRKFLLEMATGTGKTLLCAALIKRFLQTRNAERVLFVVDRIELAKQTMEDFGVILRDFGPVIFKTARHKPGGLLGSSVVVATIQSLMVDRRYREEFTPFHFDLVINDEAHRSIYGDSREVVQFFQATRIGLTATPRAYLANVDVDQLAVDNPKALEARQLRDTYHYFGCEPGNPTFRYDIVDAAKDPEGPFLCLPRIVDIRTDITTQALDANGWSVTIDEREESFKVQDLERKVFTPDRNRAMCEAFLGQGQKDPGGDLGRSIVFAVNQRHATELTKQLNAIVPEIAITVTSRIPEASEIAKDFRDRKRKERVAVSVDMLSTGYNCPDLLNVVLMRPVFSPTEYVQIKGRGTRRFTFKTREKAFDKEYFAILDFCGVAEYFEDSYDYSVPLKVPVEHRNPEKGPGGTWAAPGSAEVPTTGNLSPGAPVVPVWTGRDLIVSEEVRIVGPDGEKVDVMTFRGAFRRDVVQLADTDPEFRFAVSQEDDDAIEGLLQERLFHRPEMYYSPEKLIIAHGRLPATTSAFVYEALGLRPLPTRDVVVQDTVDSISSRFNLRYEEELWLLAAARLVIDDSDFRRAFMAGDMTVFSSTQFNQLGGLAALLKFRERELVFEALRQSTLAQQSARGEDAA